jgi:transglutaminase-like putative cysteine protease
VSAESSPVTYEVTHTTRYVYTNSVSVSHHLARLSPRALPYQECLHHELVVTPEPAVRTAHTDYFGNAMTFFAMQGAHKELTVTATSRVTVAPRALPVPSETPSWELAADQSVLPLEALDALFDALSFESVPAFEEYARRSFPSGRPLMEAVLELTHRIYEDFTFDPRATTVNTSLSEVFRMRRGVCQDFARFEIACLRSLGLPAHYISGYLETAPPPGKPRHVGADASHAWLAVFVPGTGWVDLDPTNDVVPSTRHVTLAWGRDYGDVSPVHGVILGGGGHTLQVSVDVSRMIKGQSR